MCSSSTTTWRPDDPTGRVRRRYDARHTSDPVEFFELVRSWAPEIVVVDLIMPDLDGIDVLAKLAERRSTARS